MIDELRSYILENEYKITVLPNKIDILNYQDIDHFDDSQIIVKFTNGKVNIQGENLTISKLLNDELLILGKIKTITFHV